MTGFTALELARIQFAFTMSFHILFPAVSIGLASYLAALELSWLRTRQQVYVDLYPAYRNGCAGSAGWCCCGWPAWPRCLPRPA
jgi:hypothetical protein